MAFQKKTWVDRLTEFATRRIITNVTTREETLVEVARAEGDIYEAGDAFNAETMNDLEDRIAAQFEEVGKGVGVVDTYDNVMDMISQGKIEDDTFVSITDDSDDDSISALAIDYDNTQSGLTATEVQGAIDEVKRTSAPTKRFNGNTVATWMDIPSSESTSGKKTRVFISDNEAYIGLQIFSSDGATIEKGAILRMVPTITPITFINEVTTSEQVNCNFIDFGTFFIVNLAGVIVPGGARAICQLPAFSRCRINVTLSSGIIIYIDPSTREIKSTGAVSGFYATFVVPVYDARY